MLDTFCGSGTTILAAERVGRRAYALELEPRYVDVAIRRWQAFTRRDAVHAETGSTFDELALDRSPPPSEQAGTSGSPLTKARTVSINRSTRVRRGMARKSKIKAPGSDDRRPTGAMMPSLLLPRRRSTRSVQAGPRKNTGASRDKAATPRAQAERASLLPDLKQLIRECLQPKGKGDPG